MDQLQSVLTSCPRVLALPPTPAQGRMYSCPEDVLKPVPERKRTYRADGTWS